MKPLIPLFFLALSFCSASSELLAQKGKQALTIEDIRQWREHSVSLSDDGNWYTVRYKLKDKDVAAKSDEEKATMVDFSSFYGDENQTDVLYIHHADDGLKYSVEDAEKPTFSADAQWIAYQVVRKAEGDEEDKETRSIELKHLESGFTKSYETEAQYQFAEEQSLFLTSDENSLLIYNLNTRTEHFIGDIGEYRVEKASGLIAYSIRSKDKRGNGVYLYDPSTRTTRTLITGATNFSDLAWNEAGDALVLYRYQRTEEEVDESSIVLMTVENLKSAEPLITEYSVEEMNGFAEDMGLTVQGHAPVWSSDGERLFVKVKSYAEGEQEEASEVEAEDAPTVQIWHWKDEKLLSQRIMELKEKENEVFDAVFNRNTVSIVQLTGPEIQSVEVSEGTDRWGIGLDNRDHISDWDVQKNDLYKVDLVNGVRTLIHKGLSRSYYNKNFELSPDGQHLVYWDEEHFWHHDLETDEKQNISAEVKVSFIDTDHDQFGYTPSHGFTGWVKGQDAVIVNHEHNLWMLPFDTSLQPENLTAEGTARDSIRFRLEDTRSRADEKIEDRYLDLSSGIILTAYDTHTKESGFYALNEGGLQKLIYGEFSSYHWPWFRYRLLKSKDSDAIIFMKGDYQNYPEAYLSRRDFSSSKRITDTNPQQAKFSWGRRILIEYQNDDGVPLQGILSIPDNYKSGQKLPMIVHSYEKFSWRRFIHASTSVSGAVPPEMLYVSNDYLYLQPDIHFNIGTPHSDMHECIDAAIEKVMELGYVDEERIGYEGFSFGGHCGMFVSTQANRFAAIAAGAGVSNLVQGFNLDIVWDGSNEQDYYMTSQGRLATDPTSDTEMYIRESPVFQAQTMDTPLLLFHGTADDVVQWEHSFGFYSILRYLKKPVVFLSYRGENHGLELESNRLDFQYRLKDFFDHHLKGAEAKDWMLEETPYVPIEAGEEEDRMLPEWK